MENEEKVVRLNVTLKDEAAGEFRAVQKYIGVNNKTEVVRVAIAEFARAHDLALQIPQGKVCQVDSH